MTQAMLRNTQVRVARIFHEWLRYQQAYFLYLSGFLGCPTKTDFELYTSSVNKH